MGPLGPHTWHLRHGQGTFAFTRRLRLFLLQRLCPGLQRGKKSRSSHGTAMSLDGFEEQTLTKPCQLCPVLLSHPPPGVAFSVLWDHAKPLRTEVGQMASYWSQLSCRLTLRPLVSRVAV